MTRERLRIAVTGLAATYPFGGVFWDYMQYALGFHQLGHDVLYIEDTGRWSYDPVGQTFRPDGSDNAAWLARHIRQLEPAMADRWFFRDGEQRTFGRSWEDVRRFCAGADLFLHISASCLMRDEYLAADTLAFIDSDPMYTQAMVARHLRGEDDEQVRYRFGIMERHDVFFTFAENIGDEACLVPRAPFDWHPTRQPVVLNGLEPYRRPIAARRRCLTTVASWEPTEEGPVIDGVRYGGKSVEILRLLDLPARSPLPLELSLSGRYPQELLRQHGWHVRPAYEVSADPWMYRDYLARSFGEWSIAKQAYVAGRTGWFSCRSACYMALGVPVIVQDTGFSRSLPTGSGLLCFDDLDGAAAAIEDVRRAPEGHASAAFAIAREHFAADRVLPALLDRASARRTSRVPDET